MFGWLFRIRPNRAACRTARAAFDREHPVGRSWDAVVVAEETGRHIVRVFCGDSDRMLPPWLVHYAVPKVEGASAERLADDVRYRPKKSR
jgi:hypothetical protein